MANRKLLALYIGISGVRSEDVEQYVHQIASRITPETFEGEIIIIPTNSSESRIECIDPVYITSESLIAKHTQLMTQLHEELGYQISELRKENGKED